MPKTEQPTSPTPRNFSTSLRANFCVRHPLRLDRGEGRGEVSKFPRLTLCLPFSVLCLGSAQTAVNSVAETALNHGNLAVADKARRELVRVSPTTNTNLEARKKEILSLRPLLRVAPSK